MSRNWKPAGITITRPVSLAATTSAGFSWGTLGNAGAGHGTAHNPPPGVFSIRSWSATSTSSTAPAELYDPLPLSLLAFQAVKINYLYNLFSLLKTAKSYHEYFKKESVSRGPAHASEDTAPASQNRSVRRLVRLGSLGLHCRGLQYGALGLLRARLLRLCLVNHTKRIDYLLLAHGEPPSLKSAQSMDHPRNWQLLFSWKK